MAARTFAENFPDVMLIHDDIKNISTLQLQGLIADGETDLIIGGPPCQSYTTIGKRKYDDKARLYNEYQRMLSIIRPRMFLFENVKGMLSMRNETGQLIIEEIGEKFNNLGQGPGYRIAHQVIDAANYGVPQHRERVFIIGIREDEDIEWDFPPVTHGNEDGLHPYLTLEQAISDLPDVNPGLGVLEYTLDPANNYQALMRFGSERLTEHFAAIHGDKIQTVINHVVPGEGKDYINGLVDQGVLAEQYRLTSGYKNTYGRLIANQPATTITNNLATPSGLRCIHYEFNRALTPREGARIQSFPDRFTFCGYKTHVTSQIGNAVPPLLADALARHIEQLLD